MSVIHEKVNQLIVEHKTNDPFVLAEALNFLIRYEKLPDSVNGFTVPFFDSRYLVINSDLTWEGTFVCAHELGHAILHPNCDFFFIRDHTLFVPGKFEREAHEFAIFLMTFGTEPEWGETKEQYYHRLFIPWYKEFEV